MEIPSGLIDLYDKLINKIYTDKDYYGEQQLSTFTSVVGKDYKNKLMIVGRAVNGWRGFIDKTDIKYNELAKLEVKKGFSTDNLQWVIDRWGNDQEDEDGGNYNTKKSPFWRFSKKIASELIENNDTVINEIVWSNLYKISKYDQGNPSGALMDVQFELSRDILRYEFELYKPNYIIFLTGWGWAHRFLEGISNISVNDKERYVEFVGKLNNTLIIVGQHPQGKPEQPHFEEIIEQIKRSSENN